MTRISLILLFLLISVPFWVKYALTTQLLIIALLLAASGMKSSPRDFLPAKIALFILLLVMPFEFKNFHMLQISQVMIYALAIMGLNMLTGFNGQFSLGHNAFFAIGAYTVAVLMTHYGFNFFLTLPVVALVCFVFGYLFGLPALRLEGIYLALATFALGIAMPQILKLSPFEGLLGGVHGIKNFGTLRPPPELSAFFKDWFDLSLSRDRYGYFVVLGVFAFLFWTANNVTQSRTGRAIMAIRDNPIAAQAMGVNLSLFKSMTFGLSAMYTGLAGALAAIITGSVFPESYTVILAVGLLVGMVVGGVGWLPGCLFGGLFIQYTPDISEYLVKYIPFIPDGSSKSLTGAIYAIILILIIYLMPSGLGGLLKSLSDRFKKTN